jgi:N-acetylglucosaminyl-diphospho-decaprenol L-rhamnosyltransferase
METKPEISFLIVSWNAWHHLKRCLEAIRAGDLQNYEIVVVDNGSTDETVPQLRATFPEVRLQANEANLGLPRAVNLGFTLVDGKYVMLLDADTQIEPAAIGHLVDFMDSHPEVSLTAPRILTPQGQIEESARNIPSVMSGLFGRQSVLTRWFPNNPFSARYLGRDHLASQEPFRVEQVSASSMFMRRSLIDEVGPWDENYRCYWVDTDWCLRLKKMDRQVYCVPRARTVHHENNRRENRKSPWRIWQFHMGALRLYRRHMSFGWLDPRTWLAGVLLTTRAICLLGLNALKANPAPVRAAELNRLQSVAK